MKISEITVIYPQLLLISVARIIKPMPVITFYFGMVSMGGGLLFVDFLSSLKLFNGLIQK